MPKDVKKKTHAKTADFVKQKGKVGRKLIPQSATNTAISAKSINLPNQSLSVDKDGQPTTVRNLTLDDLLVRVSHTNASSRKDALSGLKELFSAHPQFALSSGPRVIPAVLNLMTADETSVRKEFIAFFTWYTGVLPKQLLSPFVHTITLHTVQALSNIHLEIRLDAMHIVNLLLEKVPTECTRGWNAPNTSSGRSNGCGKELLNCYLVFLGVSIGTGIKTPVVSTKLSAANRASILTSFKRFLDNALAVNEEVEQGLPLFLAPAFSSQAAYHNFLDQCRPDRPKRSMAADFEKWLTGEETQASEEPGFYAPLQTWRNISQEIVNSSRQTKRQRTPLSALAELIQPSINAYFSESAHSAFVDAKLGTQVESLRVIEACLGITTILWQQIALSDCEVQPTILGKLAKSASIYLPTVSEKDRTLDRIDVLYCQSVSAYTTLRSKTPSNKKAKLHDKDAADLDNIQSYIVGSLQNATNKRSDEAATAFRQLRPLIWALLNKPEAVSSVLDAVLTLAKGVQAQSALSLAVQQFLLDVTQAQLESTYAGQFHWSSEQKSYEDWLLSLPRFLYTLQSKQPEMTLTVWRFLHHAARHPQRISLTGVLFTPSFTKPLASFFCVQISKGLVYGPFRTSSEVVKRTAVATVFYLSGGETSDLTGALATAESM